jgi:hypothetical protein
MKKILILIPIIVLLFSCENKDVIIQKSQKNCSCSNLIEEVYRAEIQKYMRSHSSCGTRGSFDCENPFYIENLNKKQFSKTNTFELKNSSETKVYDVMVQISTLGKVKYETYRIEPTDVIELGCDSNFEAKYGYYYDEPEVEGIKLSNFSKITYKIHEVNLVSEY